MSAMRMKPTDVSVDAILADCTSAVVNAENIRRARPNGARGKKQGPKAKTALSRQRQQADSTQEYDSVSRRPMPLSIVNTSTVTSPYGSPVRALSMSASTSPTHCHNPYTPGTLNGADCTAEESFFATYSESFTSSADISAISETSDVSVDLQSTSAALAFLGMSVASRRRTGTGTPSLSLSSPETPMRHTLVPRSRTGAAAAAAARDGTRSGATTTTTYDEFRTVSSSSTAGPVRVVRTVIGCSVDRASGRPIPRFTLNSRNTQ